MKKTPCSCALCQMPFAEGALAHAAGRIKICEDCAQHLTSEELLYLAGAALPRDLLPLLGFTRCGV